MDYSTFQLTKLDGGFRVMMALARPSRRSLTLPLK